MLQKIDKILDLVCSVQHNYSSGVNSIVNTEKLEAKRYAMELLNSILESQSKIIDVGGEEFYHKFLTNHIITKWNLPNDMHNTIGNELYDAAIAMHVLEHSPFPMLVLSNIYECLKPNGYLYIAVPRPTTYFETGFPDHLTIMSGLMWRKLIVYSNFDIISHTNGKFNPNIDWIEERFLCKKRSI